MTISNDTPRTAGRTRWKKLGIVMVPTLLVSGAVLAGVDAGIIPVSLAVNAQNLTLSGQRLKISADRLHGTGFVQYVVADHSKTGYFPEAYTGVKSADLYNLCQSVAVHVPLLGPATLRVSAGGGGHPAHAENLVVHTDDLSGDASFQNLTIGQDVSTMPGLSNVAAGTWGQRADAVTIDHLKQAAPAVTASSFKLAGLHLSVKAGDKSCY
ncbi:DUF6230 family protein [Streptomyces sp. RB6PN25]|uniref:DUF6230 family protein n=1 Tax=Streptomyces humicola TaxID=2953240 RepID=A0ABT1PV02_9ACTN|nr:DUF6230 family protein [Streptomyces humicola]MCQ4080375.1 DUF6230 family protein [Streptomyces humicola]